MKHYSNDNMKSTKTTDDDEDASHLQTINMMM